MFFIGIVAHKLEQKANGAQTRMVTRGMIGVKGLDYMGEDGDFTTGKNIDLRSSMGQKKKKGCCAKS